MNAKYIDVHCHPNLGALKKDQGDVIARMREEGVLGIVVGVDLESSREAVRLAGEHEHLYACVGLHPNYTQKEHFDTTLYGSLLRESKVVGVGECGLDFFRLSGYAEEVEHGTLKEEDIKKKQWEVFKQHVELALEHGKPLMIHCRPSKGSMDAYEEVADYLDQFVQHPGVAQTGTHTRLPGAAYGDPLILDVGHQVLRGNMHFFVGNLEVARRFWALGFTTSFTGVLTFTHDYDEVVREAPLDMILTETDSPYATPVPHRGEVNHPVYVKFVTQKIAELKGERLETVQEAVLQNARKLFKIGSVA